MNLKTFSLIFVGLLIVFGLQKFATYAKGPLVFLPYVLFFILLAAIVVNWRKLANFFIVLPLFFVACNTIDSDKIGVRAENYGHEPKDYSLVYGKFPAGYTEAYLRNKALDVYWSLSASPNKVFVLGDAKSLIIQ
jgi:hypothetical protein